MFQLAKVATVADVESTEIPFSKTDFGSLEIANAHQAMADFSSGNGPFTHQAEERLSRMHRGSRALLTPSCSSALELAARLIDFNPGDEIIVPSYTFVTTVSSFVTNGATPVFCDIDPSTLGMSPLKAEALITNRTVAICIVHYAGVGANPGEFKRLAEKYGLVLVEDNSHGLGGGLNTLPLGTFGAISTLSFHETKNISCGEGGAIILNDKELIERAEILREKGTNRSNFLRGQVDKYTWVDLGASWVLSDILAAILVAQLERFEEIQQSRRRIWSRYFEELSSWAMINGAVLQELEVEHTFHMFYLIFDGRVRRDSFCRHMKERGISAPFHYQPLHRSSVGSQWVENPEDFGVCDFVSNGIARLPIFPTLSESEQARVLDAAKAFG